MDILSTWSYLYEVEKQTVLILDATIQSKGHLEIRKVPTVCYYDNSL